MESAFLFMLLALGGGEGPADVASILPAESYFEARNVPVNLDNMIYLAAKAPDDGQSQIKQLLALRVLGERHKQVKKSRSAAEITGTLEKIARGESARDPQGFAQEYATIALARINGKPAKPAEAKPVHLGQEALAWFPASSALVGAVDLHPRGAEVSASAAIGQLWKMLPELQRGRIFAAADMLGNIRLTRGAFAYVDNENRRQREIYVRFTGKFTPKRLVNAIVSLSGENLQTREAKDPQGLPILYFQIPGDGPLMAIIGDSELVIAGYEDDRRDQQEVMDKLLAVRAGKQPSVVKGNLKDVLGKTSDKASAILVGAVPGALRREMLQFGGFPAVPTQIRAELVRGAEGLDVRLHATLANAEEAKTFTKFLAKAKQDGLDALKIIPAEVLPAEAIAPLRKTLESIQLMTKDNVIDGRVLAPNEALLTLPRMLLHEFRDFEAN